MPHTGFVFLVPSTHSRFRTPTTPPLPRHWRTMGQFNSEDVLEKLPKKVLTSPRGNFENSTNCHVSFEALYGILLPQGRELSKVIRTRYNYTARWISRCPLPTLLGVYGETREIALRHNKILQSNRVELVIDPAIDTLFFNSDYPRDLGESFLMSKRTS
jgi:hypothetical protein